MVQIIAFSSETVQNKKVKIISPSGFLQSEKKKSAKMVPSGVQQLVTGPVPLKVQHCASSSSKSCILVP